MSVQFLCMVCAVFVVVPLFSFQEKRFLRRKTFLVYLSLVAVIMIVSELETVYRWYTLTFAGLLNSYRNICSIYLIQDFTLVHLVAVMGEICGVLIWCTALYQTCFKGHVWESLFTGILSLEEVAQLNTIRTKEQNMLKNPNFQLLLSIMIIIALLVYERVTFRGEEKKVFLFK